MPPQQTRKKKRRFTGWRKAALANTIFLALSAVLLLSFLGAAVARSSAGLNGTFIFFRGACATSNAIDLGLHLLLNAFSTSVLASSNFFTQVLNAPSREEADVAHAKGGFLDIGVASWRNVFYHGGRRWGKTVGWLVLMVSSVPIHLIFNSVVFATDYRDTEFNLAIATEGFVRGEEYFWPGASLAPEGLGSLLDRKKSEDRSMLWEDEGYGDTHGGGRLAVDRVDDGYTLDRGQFNDTWLMEGVSRSAAEGKNWVKLAKADCVREYLTQCRGLTKYGDLIVVVDASSSWARDEVWDLNSTAAELWDSIVPARRDNSLWYAADCEADTKGRETDSPHCWNTCYRALGATAEPHDLPDGNKEEWTIDFFPDENDISRTYGTGDLWTKGYPWLWSSSSNVSEFGLRPGRNELRVDYCLAEPFPGQCSVGLSNQLLLAVAVCVLVKAITCMVVIITLRKQDPLVTLGDAIQSFISKPDPTTVGADYVSPKFKPQRREGTAKGKYGLVGGGSGPIQWQNRAQRGYSFTPWHSWLSLVLVMLLGYSSFAILKTVELGSGHMTTSAFRNLFTETNHDSDTANGYIKQSSLEMILLVNLPQIVISMWYLAYNQLLTRLVMAREWARFSSGAPQPLRVTYPRGQQVSTYFLSLPYRYSVPLLVASVITHWLVSRTVYVFVSAGSYYYPDGVETLLRFKGYDPNLPENSALQLRYSMTAHITVLMICTTLALVLLGLSLRAVSSSKNNTMVMPPVGTSSRAISGACHVSPLSKAERDLDEYQVVGGENEENYKSNLSSHVREVAVGKRKKNTSFTIRPLRNWTFGSRKDTGIHVWADDQDLESSAEAGLDPEKVRLARISRSLLAWGIVDMPEDWYGRNRMDNIGNGAGEADHVGSTFSDSDGPAASQVQEDVQVVHMSFGTPLDRVTAPEEGRWYLFR